MREREREREEKEGGGVEVEGGSLMFNAQTQTFKISLKCVLFLNLILIIPTPHLVIL